LDLLIGDVGERFEKQLSPDEERWRKGAQDQQAAYLKEWATVFARYRDLMSADSKVPQHAGEEHDRELDAAREALIRLNTIRSRFFEQEAAFKPGTQFQGRVWPFLNARPTPEPIAAN
jgi:hypothetical protein